MNKNIESCIRDLRGMADYLESHEFKIEGADRFFGSASFYIECKGIPSFKKNVRAMGAFKKAAIPGVDLEAERTFGTSKLQIYTSSANVCERIVTGTRTVYATPAIPAKPEHKEDIVEYKCPESFLDIPDDIKKEVAKNEV